MNKERRNLLLVALVAVALVAGIAWLIFSSHAPTEPVYQGKRMSEWLDMLINVGGVHIYNMDADAEEAVRQIGTNGIPTLLRRLQVCDSKLKLRLIGLAEKQHLIKFNFVASEERNQQAMMAFYILRADASNAVPALIAIYERKLSDMSQEAAAYALGFIGPGAKAALPVLLRAAANTNANADVRVATLRTLDQLDAEPKLVVPVLTRCLKESEPSVRECAGQVLMGFHSDAEAAVPALVDLLKDPDRDVRQMAEEALKAIDPETAAKAGIK